MTTTPRCAVYINTRYACVENFTELEVMDFQERQKQIYELSSFISEQEKWLEGVLGKLQWTKEYLSSVSELNTHVIATLYQSTRLNTQTRASLEQCPYNTNHYVPSSSLESHKARCWYSSQGVRVNRETAQTLATTGDFYGESDIIPHIHIGTSCV